MLSVESWAREARGVMRSFARSPWLTLAALATIGLGAGPSVVVLSAIGAAATPPIPFDDPDGLLVLSREVDGRPRYSWSFPKYDALRREVTSAELAATAYCPLTLSDAGEKRSVVAEAATSNLFAVLRVHPLRGRTFRADEDAGPLSHPVAIVSEPFARRQFGAGADPVGRTLALNGHPFTIIGEIPGTKGVSGTLGGYRPPELWIPLMMAPLSIRDAEFAQRVFEEPLVTWFKVVGRIRDGSSARAVQAEARVAFDRFTRDWPTPGVTTDRLEVRTFRAFASDPRLIRNLLVLQAAVGVVFLISIFNLAHLISVRAAERARDAAVRLALGACPTYLIARQMVEALVLGAGGAALAVALAWVTRKNLPVLRSLAEPGLLPRDGFDNVQVDASVWLGALLLALVASWVSTSFAARQAMPRAIAPVLQTGRLSARVGFRALRFWRPKGLMVTAQVAFSIALVAIALLVFRAFSTAASGRPDLHGSAALAVELQPSTAPDDTAREFTQLAVRAGDLPGVEGAAVVSCLPGSYACQSAGMKAEGDSGPPRTVGFHVVSPGSFEALGVRLQAGRDFVPTDAAESAPVAIVSETAAAQLRGSPIGQLIRLSGPVSSGRPFEVVGVASDLRYGSLAAGPQAAVYVAYPQVPHGRGFLVVRSAGDKAAITRALRERLAGDVLLRTAEVKDLGRMAEAEVSRMGFVVALISGAAGLAFLLAGLGLFAVLSHVVQRAVPEIGVRIAVGATRAQAAGLVVLAVIKVAAVGAGFGAALAFLLVRYVGGLLGGTVPIDWGAIGMAAMLAVCGAVAAGAWPAFRATRVDPVIAIRVE